MLKVSHRTLIILAGVVWIAIGTGLLTAGIRFLLAANRETSAVNQTMLLLLGALLIGYIKGKWVLSRSAHRQVKRIATLDNPTSLKNLYSKGYYILIAAMMALGMCMRFLPLTLEVRGCIDVAIGSALIHGARTFFKTIIKNTISQEKRGQ